MKEKKSTPPARRRGRPPSREHKLDLRQIIEAALAALEAGRTDFSMRGIAATLNVDAMALYHYFPSKQALVEALIDHAFESLDSLPARLARLSDPMERVQTLAANYLRCIAPLPQLTRHLARQGGGRLAARFAALFEQALGQPIAAGSAAAGAHDVLVDYLHGVALAGPGKAKRMLVAAWPLLLTGLRAALEPDAPRPP
jgi:AcrR family transcriptional regulator